MKQRSTQPLESTRIAQGPSGLFASYAQHLASIIDKQPSNSDSFQGIQTPGWTSMAASHTSCAQSKPLRDAINSRLNKENYKFETFAKNSRNSLTNKNMHSKAKISKNEALYLQSRKLVAKRQLQCLFQEAQMKKTICTFQPKINHKSAQLAQIKYQRDLQSQQSSFNKINSQNEHYIKTQQQHKNSRDLQTQPFSYDSNSSSVGIPCSLRESMAQENLRNNNKQLTQYTLLNQLFYFLSNGDLTITSKDIQNQLIELPRICLQVLQPVLIVLFKGISMNWVEFFSAFQTKCSKKQGFFKVLAKWMTDNKSKINH